jgi:hypothetical protein
MGSKALKPSVRRTVLTLSTLLASAAISSPVVSAEVAIDDLKGAYIACERADAASELRMDDIIRCSIIYEELKQRAFGGDFLSVRKWYEAVRLNTPSAASQ